jgi:undecaprenyl pyrophosphate synthase
MEGLPMRMFYIPDGHRRYADKMECSLVESYRLGYRVLVDELIVPLFQRTEVTDLDIFLLSNLNLDRREHGDLHVLLQEGKELLTALINDCRSLASVRTVGSYFPQNLHIPGPAGRTITLVIGCKTADDVGCPEVDVFLRTGGELRLSGAPRTIVGDYTQFYAIDELHPELRFAQVESCLDRYRTRYMREVSQLERRAG